MKSEPRWKKGLKLVWNRDARNLIFHLVKGTARREALYDRLYSLNWGRITTNNYGYAPAESESLEAYQLQLYTELLKLLESKVNYRRTTSTLEISCGRGGGLYHMTRHLPRQRKVVGLDCSAHAIEFCQEHYGALLDFAFVRGYALSLPFESGSFDLVVNVEASHVYGDDAAFLREVRRVLHPQGRFLYADYRTRAKMPMLQETLRAAGLLGELHDITWNVVAACEFDAARRRQAIRSGIPWYARLLFASSLENYSGLPGTVTFERFRSGDRMYFMSCLASDAQKLEGESSAVGPEYTQRSEPLDMR